MVLDSNGRLSFLGNLIHSNLLMPDRVVLFDLPLFSHFLRPTNIRSKLMQESFDGHHFVLLDDGQIQVLLEFFLRRQFRCRFEVVVVASRWYSGLTTVKALTSFFGVTVAFHT